MRGRSPRWVQTLREAIKQEHGFGWNVREIAGKVQLTRRYEDLTRSSIVLDIPWTSDSITVVLGLLQELRPRVEQQQLSLKQAYVLLRQPIESDKGAIDWSLAISCFRKYKVFDTGEVKESTYESVYQPVMSQVFQLVSGKPIPRDAKTLLGLLRDKFGGNPGSRSRQLRMQYTAQLLRYVVRELGAPARWMPPDDLIPFVGKTKMSSGIGSATPLRDQDLLRLLSDIPDPRWSDAIKLMACFGLRPVELRYLVAKDAKLFVNYSKRTARGSTSPADVPGLDPVGLEGQSLELLRRLRARQISMPPLGTSDADAAQSVRQYLNRRRTWRCLKEEVADRGGRLSAYSFRHGFALRAHETFSLSPRITAAIMRHSLQTHVRHYGHWTDAVTIDEAITKSLKLLA